MAFLLKTIRYLSFALAVLIVILLFYLSLHGFPEWAVRKIEENLKQSELTFTIEDIKFGLFHGIFIYNLKCYINDNSLEPIAKIDKLSVRPVFLLNLLEGKKPFYEFRIYNGSIIVPFHLYNTNTEAIITLTNLTGEIILNVQDKTLLCSYLSFFGHGIQAKASGTYMFLSHEEKSITPHINASKVATLSSLSTHKTEIGYFLSMLSAPVQNTLNILSHIKTSESTLNADISFYINHAVPQQNTINLTLIAKKCAYNYVFSEKCILRATISPNKNAIELAANNAMIKQLPIASVIGKGFVDGHILKCEQVTLLVDTNKPENIIKGHFAVGFTNHVICLNGNFYGDFDTKNLIRIFPEKTLSNVLNNLAFEMDDPAFKCHITLLINSNITSEFSGEIQGDHIIFRNVSNDFANARVHISTSNEHNLSL